MRPTLRQAEEGDIERDFDDYLDPASTAVVSIDNAPRSPRSVRPMPLYGARAREIVAPTMLPSRRGRSAFPIITRSIPADSGVEDLKGTARVAAHVPCYVGATRTRRHAIEGRHDRVRDAGRARIPGVATKKRPTAFYPTRLDFSCAT